VNTRIRVQKKSGATAPVTHTPTQDKILWWAGGRKKEKQYFVCKTQK
jgi:hypothetical protein